jgi:hypothetical protein
MNQTSVDRARVVELLDRSRANPWHRMRAPIVLVAGALLAFSPTLFSSFHFDDYSLFSDPIVTSSTGWWEVFRLERTRPLTYFTFWLNFQAGSNDPVGYHAGNLFIHLAAVWLAWSIFREVTDPKVALVAAAVFALHPLQSEPVAYIFARATLLSALFCLLAWKDWLDERPWRAAAFFGAALLAKEEAIAFPAFLCGFEWICRRHGWSWLRDRVKPLSAMFGLAALAAARLFYAESVTKGAGIGFELGEITPARYLLTQGRVIWEYLGLLVWPAGLNFDRDFPLLQLGDFSAWLAWILLAGSIAASIGASWWLAGKRGTHPPVYWLLGFFILLAPTSSIVPLADLIAERRMYLPMLSLSLAIGFLMKRTPNPALLAAGLVLCGLSFQRSLVWQTEESLWRDTVEKSPSKVRPKLQLARALEATRGTDAEGLALLQQAKALAPTDADVATELGVFHLKAGDAESALAEFQIALNSTPSDAQALTNYGAALYSLGDTGRASGAFDRALRSDPCHFDARNNSILLANAVGQTERAVELSRAPTGCRYTREQAAALAAGLR